jgi:hypothetical protein
VPATPSCPYCQAPVRAARTACPACGAPHHPECWVENAGCAVPLCEAGPSLPYMRPPAEPDPGRERLTIEFGEVSEQPDPPRPPVVVPAPPRSEWAPPPAASGDDRRPRRIRPLILVGLALLGVLGVGALMLSGAGGDDAPGGGTLTQPTGEDPRLLERAGRRTAKALGIERGRARELNESDRVRDLAPAPGPVPTDPQPARPQVQPAPTVPVSPTNTTPPPSPATPPTLPTPSPSPAPGSTTTPTGTTPKSIG